MSLWQHYQITNDEQDSRHQARPELCFGYSPVYNTVPPPAQIVLLPVTAPFFSWLNLGMMRSEIMRFHTRATAIPAARCAVMDPCAHITHKWVWLQVIIQMKQTAKSCMSDALWMLQMVWASSNRVGCAIQTCYNMVVWGAVWREATYLVCNYSPKLVMLLSFNVTLARPYTLQEHRVCHS